MIVGTWASSPAPTTSPIAPPAFRGIARVLDVAVEVEAPGAAFAADAGQPGAAERRPQVTDEEAVDPDGAGDEAGRYPLGPPPVAGEQGRRQPVAGAVGQRDRLVLGSERLQGEHRAEHFGGEDLRAGGRTGQQRRLIVEAAEFAVRRAAGQRARARGHRAPDEAVYPLQVRPGDVRPDVGGLVPRVALAQGRGAI